jgi:hypothetical protein
MGVSLAPVAKPGLSPSCPRRRASSPLLSLPWIPAFAGMTKPAPFNARLLGAFGKRKVTHELLNS